MLSVGIASLTVQHDGTLKQEAPFKLAHHGMGNRYTWVTVYIRPTFGVGLICNGPCNRHLEACTFVLNILKGHIVANNALPSCCPVLQRIKQFQLGFRAMV